MSATVAVVPSLYEWALERAGWDEETTARRAPKVYEWISGDSAPTLKQLQAFAHHTHTAFGFFFLPEPPVEELPIPDMRTVGNRGVLKPSGDLLDTIAICQTRQDWYREYVRDNGIPAPGFVGSATIETSPKDVARTIREKIGVGVDGRLAIGGWKESKRKIIDLIEDLGVLVMINGVVGVNTHRKLNPQEFRGFALVDPLAPLIFVNGADTQAAQIFTLFHELAHVWLGCSALSAAAIDASTGAEEELWCNRVAAEVLVPEDELRKLYSGEASEAELNRLAKFFRVSTLVVLKSVYDMGALEWDDFRAKYAQELDRVLGRMEAAGGNDVGGNFYYTHPIKISRRFAKAVYASTFEGGTSYRDAYRLLDTRKHATFENLAMELGVA